MVSPSIQGDTMTKDYRLKKDRVFNIIVKILNHNKDILEFNCITPQEGDELDEFFTKSKKWK